MAAASATTHILRSSDPLPLLSGVRVIDLADDLCGQYTAALLGGLGAAVTAYRDPVRPPLAGMAPERAALWQPFLDIDKVVRPVAALDDAVEHGAGDVAVTTARAGSAEMALVERLRVRFPGLVVVSVTPFGLTGEYAHWQTDEAVEWAMGGQTNLAGDRRKPPLMLPGMVGQLHAGMQAALGAVAARRLARLTGEGQQVEVTAFEAVASAHCWTFAAWTHNGRVTERFGTDTAACKDGRMMFVPRLFNPDLFVLMERPELAEDERFATFPAFIKNNRLFWKTFEEWSLEHTRAEIWERAQALHIPSCPVYEVGDVAAMEQTAARGWVRETGQGRFPGRPFVVTTTPAAPRRPRVVRPAQPLDGVRVVELTTNWAGPLAGRHLGDLGADVIKLELARRPASRGSYYPGKDPMKYHVNRSGYFNKMNRNKRGICLDLSRAEGREVFHRLLDEADVVVENNSPRVMPNFGLGYAALAERHPGLIMCSISAFGSEGPLRDMMAFGTNIEGSSGLVANNGYAPGDVYGTVNFFPDPVSGTHAAVAVLAALEHRDATGDGTYVDLSLQDAATSMLAEHFLRYFAGDTAPGPRPQDDSITLRETVKCMGEDSWLAVAVRAGDDLHALARVLAVAALPPFAELRAGDGRALLAERLRRWGETVDHREGARLLQAVGVAAGPVYKNWELLADNTMAARGFFVPISHPEVGTYPFPGFPWRFEAGKPAVRLPAPLLGQHTREVFTGVAGLSDAAVTALEESGVAERYVRMAPLGMD